MEVQTPALMYKAKYGPREVCNPGTEPGGDGRLQSELAASLVYNMSSRNGEMAQLLTGLGSQAEQEPRFHTRG